MAAACPLKCERNFKIDAPPYFHSTFCALLALKSMLLKLYLAKSEITYKRKQSEHGQQWTGNEQGMNTEQTRGIAIAIGTGYAHKSFPY